MSLKRYMPAAPAVIIEPSPDTRTTSDRLHSAIIRGKYSTVVKLIESGLPVETTNKSGYTPLFCAAFLGHFEIVKLLLKFGADPNRRCSIDCSTPVHAACFSCDLQLLKALLVAGGDLRLHDRHNRSPRDWAMLQPNENLRTQTCSLIESFRQATMRTTDCSYHELGFAELNSISPHRSRQTLRLPAKFRNTLAALGLVYNEDYEYIGPLGTMQGTGFGKIVYGKGETAAALWPVPLVDEADISDPDKDSFGEQADLNGLLPRAISYRCGPLTEMVFKRWHRTAVSLRRMKDSRSCDLLLEELHNMSRLRHPGLLLLLGVSPVLNFDSVQLIYEPVYNGSLHHRLHIMGSPIPIPKRVLILQQICDALIFLHSQKLLHCSISSHAVHLISSSRPKLGCLETMSDMNDPSRKVYRKVPGNHWDALMPWLSPECARGETLGELSDVYSFCVLAWETCTGKLPWQKLDSAQISQMWQNDGYLEPKMLAIDPTIPAHIKTFLGLGLQPELVDRRGIDLQEIHVMLRLQATLLAKKEQAEKEPKEPPPKQNYYTEELPFHVPVPNPVTATRIETQTNSPRHDWKYVKESLKRMRVPVTPPPPPPPIPKSDIQGERQPDPEESNKQLDECLTGTELYERAVDECLRLQNPSVHLRNVTEFQYPISPQKQNCGEDPEEPRSAPSVAKHYRTPSNDFAIKPASHTTERHAGSCILNNEKVAAPHHVSSFENLKSLQSYATLPPDVRSSVVPPCKHLKDANEFKLWHEKIDQDNPSSDGRQGQQTYFASTPKHELRLSESFITSSPLVVDRISSKSPQPPVKPKRSLKFFLPKEESSPSSYSPRFPSPSTNIVAALTECFDRTGRKPQSILKSKTGGVGCRIADTSCDGVCVSRGTQYDDQTPSRDDSRIGDTIFDEDAVSRGVQCENDCNSTCALDDN